VTTRLHENLTFERQHPLLMSDMQFTNYYSQTVHLLVHYNPLSTYHRGQKQTSTFQTIFMKHLNFILPI